MRTLFLLSILFTVISAKEPDAVINAEKSVDSRATISIIASNDSTKKYIKRVNKIFISDFKVSGHFLVDENITTGSYNVIADSLKSKSQYTLVYRYIAGGGASLDIKLFKGHPKKLILHKNYSVSLLEKSPFLMHKAVSDINDIAKFPSIDWINKFVLLSRYIGPKETEIMLADYSFNYKKVILKGGLNLFPKWADKNQKEFYYSNYQGDNLTLYKLNIYTGKRKKIITTHGMLACSDVSKDGTKLLLTMAPNNQPDIYLYQNGQTTKVTNYSGIDVSGHFADNDKTLVFISNRLGSPNIFKKPINGGAVSQLVFHGKNNSSVDTFNNMVVYSSKEGRGANIYITDTSNSQTRPLTSGGVNLFPRFSSDGKVLLYIKRSYSGNSIGFINLSANRSEIFKLGVDRIQAIDW